MKVAFIVAGLIMALSVSAQKSPFSISIAAKTEVLFQHAQIPDSKGNYPARVQPGAGVAAEVDYRFANGLYLNGGVALISRQFGLIRLEHGLLPPPRGSNTYELSYASPAIYHILDLPLGLGYRFPSRKRRMHLGIDGGIATHYLISAHYDAGRYTGTYNKGYVYDILPYLGFSIEVGLTKRLAFASGIRTDLGQAHLRDAYVYTPDQEAHQAISMMSGLTWKFN